MSSIRCTTPSTHFPARLSFACTHPSLFGDAGVKLEFHRSSRCYLRLTVGLSPAAVIYPHFELPPSVTVVKATARRSAVFGSGERSDLQYLPYPNDNNHPGIAHSSPSNLVRLRSVDSARHFFGRKICGLTDCTTPLPRITTGETPGRRPRNSLL